MVHEESIVSFVVVNEHEKRTGGGSFEQQNKRCVGEIVDGGPQKSYPPLCLK